MGSDGFIERNSAGYVGKTGLPITGLAGNNFRGASWTFPSPNCTVMATISS